MKQYESAKGLGQGKFSMGEESTGFLLWKITDLWQRELKKRLDPFALTHCQFTLLASILWNSREKENVTQSDLSEHTRVDPMTTSSVVRTMEKRGLLIRKEHPSDSRAKVIILTMVGRELVQSAIREVELFEQDFFAPFAGNTHELNLNLAVLLKRPR